MDKKILLYHIGITLCHSLSPKLKRDFLKQIGGVTNFFNLSEKQFKNKIEKLKLKKPFEGRNHLIKEAKEMSNICQAKDIQIICFEDNRYPFRLRHIYAPPLLLYVKGDINKWDSLTHLESPYLGVVGTRTPSLYSKDFTSYIASSLAKKGAIIISGLAIGIDAEAHLGSLDFGKTLAVLGSGVDIIYPRQNLQLAQKILEKGGLLVSEYPPGTNPLKHHFPLRNRIISALSDAILMVEAKKRSGALITTQYALDQGKEIMVMSPPDNNERYFGNKHWIEEGATPISKGIDVEQYFYPQIKNKDANADNNNDPLLNYLYSGPKSLQEIASFLKSPTAAETIKSIMPHVLKGKIIESPGDKYYLSWDS